MTGADGLVGNALRRIAPHNTIYVNREDADLADFQQTMTLLVAESPTHVIHLAAVVGGIGGNLMHSGEFFRENILINTNVLECARIAGVTNLVSFMSTCVFPDAAPYPLSVENLHDGPPHPSNFGYAYAKRMLEVQSRAYRAQWGMNYSVLVPTNIFGPHDNWSLDEGHVIPSLIHKAYIAKVESSPLYVWGSGQPLREFIYSEDVARLALWAASNYSSPEPLILTSGVETSIREVVDTIAGIMELKSPVEFDSTKPEGQFRKPSNPKPLEILLPDFHFTPVLTGLEKTVDWFESNYPNVRM